MNARFRIVFAGELQGQIQARKVIERLVATFKLPEDRARELVLDGKRHVLKKDLDEQEAERYRAALLEAGMIVQVEPMAPPTEEPSPPPGGEPPPPRADPDAAPRAELRPEPKTGELRGPAGVPTGHGWAWIVRGFWHFKTNPGAWFLALICLVGISIVLGFIPVVGTLLTSLFSAVIPFGLGLLVAWPTLTAAVYVADRDIYCEQRS